MTEMKLQKRRKINVRKQDIYRIRQKEKKRDEMIKKREGGSEIKSDGSPADCI